MAKSTQDTILFVARKHFVQSGYAGTRMQEIADEAGINKAMLHYYFRSKEKLFHEIISQILNTLVPNLAKAMEHPGSFYERVEKIIDTYINLLSDQADIPFFFMFELSQKRESFIEEIKKRSSFFPSVQSFLGQMTKEMQAGKIRKIHPIQLVLNIMGMTIFPFMVKPVFCTIFTFPEEDFNNMMQERKKIILEFINNALRPDEIEKK